MQCNILSYAIILTLAQEVPRAFGAAPYVLPRFVELLSILSGAP